MGDITWEFNTWSSANVNDTSSSFAPYSIKTDPDGSVYVVFDGIKMKIANSIDLGFEPEPEVKKIEMAEISLDFLEI